MSCHLINGITSLGEWCDGQDPSVSLALWSWQFHCYCFLHDLYMFLRLWDYATPAKKRLCNSQIPEEHFVCYQMSQHKWVITKVLYRCLRRCLLGWHRSRIGFVTPSIGEVSLGPLGNAHHKKPCKQSDWCLLCNFILVDVVGPPSAWFCRTVAISLKWMT